MALWWQGGSSRLPEQVRSQLSAPSTPLCLSVASLWEIHIKRALGKLEVSDGVLTTLLGGSLSILPIEAADAEAAADLPLLHRDLFDRMLIAQALRQGLTLVTADGKVAAYDVPILDAKPKRRR